MNIKSVFTVLLLFGCSFLPSKKSLANIAQPGIWNAGGTAFTILFPEDSNAFRKVQMLQEKIWIQLYEGFVVVKGEYLMQNTSSEKLHFMMGYPIRGIYKGGDGGQINRVSIDSLSQFKIKSDGNWLPVFTKEKTEKIDPVEAISKNWKLWEMNFLPQELKKVTVYFLVNTNNSQLSQGYSNVSRNIFIYLLESGSSWKQPIKKGNFYVQLMDNFDLKDVSGISKGFNFKYNKKYRLFSGKKTNFSPTSDDNLVVVLPPAPDSYSFDKIHPKAEMLFAGIDQLSQMPLDNLTYKHIQINSPYDLENNTQKNTTSLPAFLLFYLPIILGILIGAIILWLMIKQIKKRKQKN